MNNKRIFLDVHAIQTVPPSNINRDDTGSPKTAQYGGTTRARVSSQAWKRAMRQYFYANSEQTNIGVRTLDIVRYVADQMKKIDTGKSDEEAMKRAEDAINAAGIKTKEQKARALFFLGQKQAERLAQAALDGLNDKKQLQQILQDNPALDIALFGRMVADDPSLNEDASAQVAHAISTHSVQTEFDFYTAVDDLQKEDNAGAGMLGTIEFNASTLYRYANVAVHALSDQLQDKDAVIGSLCLFVEAFANAMPTGKANTFANQTLPQALLVSIRTDRPVNLVSAFEEPMRSRDGYGKESIQKLLAEYEKVEKFVAKPALTLVLRLDGNEEDGQKGLVVQSLGELLDQLRTGLNKQLQE
ncbi:MAG: type I-E CRISPR-associated protein Cas7/Cse4/CasC [Tissierellia bacterium]|nr:type I-E CRISPR-associated protein Cas7/Cse4/CasC [Tissierellia bacterium]